MHSARFENPFASLTDFDFFEKRRNIVPLVFGFKVITEFIECQALIYF